MDNKKSVSKVFTERQLYHIAELKLEGLTFKEIAKKINKKYDLDVTADICSGQFTRHKDSLEISDHDYELGYLKGRRRQMKTSAVNAKENRTIIDNLVKQEDMLTQIAKLVDKINSKEKIWIPNLKKSPGKKKMTMELMLSDLHYGKLTETFNLKVARERMREVTTRVLKEIERYQKEFNVERLIVALIGDIIESATMHGVESMRGCEFDNARQMFEAINSILEDCLIPLAKTGMTIHIPAVTGNHDRTETHKTYHNAGETNLTYTIYKSLELFCQKMGLKNVTFEIPIGLYQLVEIYGDVVCYDHGDADGIKGGSKASFESRITNLQNQSGKIIKFYRCGHWHESFMFGRGRIIVNESLPGADSYSKAKGFNSHAGQTLNFYVETSERPDCFYQTFPIYLK